MDVCQSYFIASRMFYHGNLNQMYCGNSLKIKSILTRVNLF